MITQIDKKQLLIVAGGANVKTALARPRPQNEQPTPEDMYLLWRCAQDYDALAPVRREHERNVRYKNGDQWSDMVEDPDSPGKQIREEALISRNGKVPLKHNFIQQYIRNIHGQLLSSPTQTVVYARSKDDQSLGDMLTNTLHACHQLNQVRRLDVGIIEELCLTGVACVKVRYDYWSQKNRTDGRLDMVNINRLFLNHDTEDPRMFDLRRIGEIHDYTFDDLVRYFADSPQDELRLARMYGVCEQWRRMETVTMGDRLYNVDFLVPADQGKFRVIEAWERLGRWVLYVHDYAAGTEEVFTDLTIEQVDRMNAQRLEAGRAAGLADGDIKLIYARQQYEYYWCVKFLTPTGVCIKQMETPYTHEEHPYALAMMPMVDGKIKAVLSDIIDIQRYINRLLTMLDFIIGSSAKGLLMVPEEAIPDGWDLSRYAKEYTKANGVILIKAGSSLAGKLPTQVTNNATNVGAWEMFTQQMNLMQQISGLSGAAQGQLSRPGTPSSLYAQEAQNSMLNFVILFECFSMFCEQRDEKLLKVLMQYYGTRRYVDISGKAYSETAKYYEPRMARQIIDFNLSTAKSTDTPVFRQMADDMLMKLLEAGMIPLELFLENSSMPFSDKLLNDMRQLQDQAQAGQVDPAMIGQMQAQAAGQADPQAMAMMQQYLGQ